jgi:DNA-directed RNA polymerase specialized sigma24 family protein
LRHALIAAYGNERGREAAAEAWAYAWEHWDRVRGMAHPVPYLYRVGQSRTRRRRHPVVFGEVAHHEPWIEPKLSKALRDLTERQRVTVVLVHGFAWTLREVAELTGIRVTSVQNHLERGLAHLRQSLEVENDV